MSPSRPFAVSVGLAAGLIAAVGFYTAASGADVPAPLKAKPQSVPAVAVVTPAPSVSFAPCVKPAKLEHGACVTHKVVTKVVRAQAPAPVVALPQPTAASHRPVVAATSRTAVAAVTAGKHEEAARPAAVAVPEDENADAQEAEPEDTEGTEATEQGDDHGDDHADETGEDHGDEPADEPGDDAGEPGDD